MNTINMINDIKYLIMENYSDKEPLSEDKKASKKVFFEYCNTIRKELEEYHRLKNTRIIVPKFNQKDAERYIDMMRDSKLIPITPMETDIYEKSIKIIAQKWVDTVNLRYFKTVEDYNVCFDKDQQLTQEEFDLLKEVLKND